MTMQHLPIETSLGVLFGRDCIYLDSEEFDEKGQTLTLKGEINGALVSNAPRKVWIPYAFKFKGVVWYQKRDLDADWTWKASFEERKNTAELKKYVGTIRHYFVQTDDDLFDVLCDSYQLEFDEEYFRSGV